MMAWRNEKTDCPVSRQFFFIGKLLNISLVDGVLSYGSLIGSAGFTETA